MLLVYYENAENSRQVPDQIQRIAPMHLPDGAN
jgi:hypothetical protein